MTTLEDPFKELFKILHLIVQLFRFLKIRLINFIVYVIIIFVGQPILGFFSFVFFIFFDPVEFIVCVHSLGIKERQSHILKGGRVVGSTHARSHASYILDASGFRTE